LEGPEVITERDKILGRIREGLKIAAPKPGAHDHSHAQSGNVADARGNIRRWLPLVGASFDEQVAVFRASSLELKTDFQLLNSQEDFEVALRSMGVAEGWKKIATHEGTLTNASCPKLSLPILRTDKAYDVKELETCDAGITECDALVAQTGTVIVTSRSSGGRALSVLPPHHVVLARRDQLVADLPAALALVKQKYEPNFPSMISLVTGPSRTGDIERILVLGAHGPKKLTVLVF
jgi:L-lactate dehydrogenase complex protein LldG